jgi:hypothetical protein
MWGVGHAWERRQTHIVMCYGSMKNRHNLEDLGVDGIIILK